MDSLYAEQKQRVAEGVEGQTAWVVLSIRVLQDVKSGRYNHRHGHPLPAPAGWGLTREHESLDGTDVAYFDLPFASALPCNNLYQRLQLDELYSTISDANSCMPVLVFPSYAI